MDKKLYNCLLSSPRSGNVQAFVARNRITAEEDRIGQHELNEPDADEDLKSVHTSLATRREDLEAGNVARTHHGRMTHRSHCHHQFAISSIQP